MIRSLAFAASRDVVLGIGTSGDRRMPVSLRPTRSTSPTARRTSARCAPCTAPSRARLSTAAILLGVKKCAETSERVRSVKPWTWRAELSRPANPA